MSLNFCCCEYTISCSWCPLGARDTGSLAMHKIVFESQLDALYSPIRSLHQTFTAACCFHPHNTPKWQDTGTGSRIYTSEWQKSPSESILSSWHSHWWCENRDTTSREMAQIAVRHSLALLSDQRPHSWLPWRHRQAVNTTQVLLYLL